MIPRRAQNFGTFFVTTQTWERRSLFQVDELARLLIKTLYNYRAQGKYLLHDFVIMPNHVHIILTPQPITLERAIQFIKGGYSHAVGQTGRNSEVWQKGFTDHRIRDAEDYQQHKNYLELNPVRRGLCAAPQLYTFSSASGAYEIDKLPQRLKPLVLTG